MEIEIGKGLTMNVDTESLREQAQAWEHVVYIGLRNILMDAHAGVKKEDFEGDDAAQKYRDESLAMSQKKLDALFRNEVRANRSTGPRISSADPVEAEAQREARTFIFGRARGWEKGKKEALDYLAALAKALEMDGKDSKEILAAAVKRRASKPESLEAARKIVEAKKSIQVDVESLGL
jgi:hypothetical protein